MRRLLIAPIVIAVSFAAAILLFVLEFGLRYGDEGEFSVAVLAAYMFVYILSGIVFYGVTGSRTIVALFILTSSTTKLLLDINVYLSQAAEYGRLRSTTGFLAWMQKFDPKFFILIAVAFVVISSYIAISVGLFFMRRK